MNIERQSTDLDCYRAALAALMRRHGEWYFGPREWVPDEFERLEREGFVHCEFGFADLFSAALRSRTIRITEKGRRTWEAIKDDCAKLIGIEPIFSFHTAIERQRPGKGFR